MKSSRLEIKIRCVSAGVKAEEMTISNELPREKALTRYRALIKEWTRRWLQYAADDATIAGVTTEPDREPWPHCPECDHPMRDLPEFTGDQQTPTETWCEECGSNFRVTRLVGYVIEKGGAE